MSDSYEHRPGGSTEAETSGSGTPRDTATGGRVGQVRRELVNLQGEFRTLRMSDVIPLAAWLTSRPWQIAWVRWFGFYALFPLVLWYWLGRGEADLGNTVRAFGIYFALIWLSILKRYIHPGRIDTRLLVQVSLFTLIPSIFLVLVVQQLPVISALYSSTRADLFVFRWLGFVLGVGLLEEFAKALPVYLFVYRQRRELSPLTYAFVGMVSGLTFGIKESVPYSYRYAGAFEQSVAGGMSDITGTFILVQLVRLITLPLLHACWCGIVSYFFGLAATHRTAPRALLLFGWGLCAVLHGTFDAFSGSLIGVLVAALSIFIFISYICTDAARAEPLADPVEET